jgi:hypothetical protein
MAILKNLQIDIVESEQVTYTNTVTDKPIESKNDIADHIENKPLEISIPVLFVGPDWKTKYDELKKLRDSNELISYYGNFQVYENMVITRISPIKESSISDGFRTEIKLKQVRVIELETIDEIIKNLGVDPVTGSVPQVTANDEQTKDKDTKEEEIDESTLISHLYKLLHPEKKAEEKV